MGGKIQRNNSREKFHLIRLGRKDSATYVKTISDQNDPQSKKSITTPPAVPGWRSVKVHFQANTNNEVIEWLLKHEELYRDAVQELDKQLGTAQDNDESNKLALPLPTSKRPRIEESQTRLGRFAIPGAGGT